MRINIPEAMWERLKEHVEEADYCYLCDHHPHSGHDRKCPLYEEPSEADADAAP